MASWLKLSWNVDPEPLMVPLGTVPASPPPPDVVGLPLAVVAGVAVVELVDDFDELLQPVAISPARATSPALARRVRRAVLGMSGPPGGASELHAHGMALG